MLRYWSLFLVVIAIIAGLFGFAFASLGIARFVFSVSLALLAFSLACGLAVRRGTL